VQQRLQRHDFGAPADGGRSILKVNKNCLKTWYQPAPETRRVQKTGHACHGSQPEMRETKEI